MNIKLSKNTKRILLLMGIILLLSGCTPIQQGAQHQYSLETTFMEIFSQKGFSNKFSAIFVWPLAQLINLIVYKLGWNIIAAIGITTFVVNLITLPLTINAQKGQSKMQLIQPELNKIQARYEGKTDQRSQMQQSAEMQKLYQKHDINLGKNMMGMFLPFPIMIAMYQSVIRASAVYSSSLLGNDLTISIMEGIKGNGDKYIYIAIFVIMAIFQLLSTKIPQWLAKYRLEQDRSYKAYDPVQAAPPQGQSMTYVMLVFILILALQMPVTMSIYWIFSSLMNILKAVVADYLTGRDEA